MRYRAIVTNVTDTTSDRPVQCFAESLMQIKEWARGMAKRHNSTVEIYEMVETLIGMVEPEDKT